MSTSPIRRVLDRLADSGLHETGSGWSARCPGHEDRKASLSVSEGEAGRVLLKCHAGCDHKKIVAALGLEESDLFDGDEKRPAAATKAVPPKKPRGVYGSSHEAKRAYERKLGAYPRVWAYHDRAGHEVGLVLRWAAADGSKEVRPVSRHADGWRLEHMSDPRPLYRLPKLLAAATSDRVYVVEGEKCSDAAGELGLLATTSSGGSNAASKTDWSPLAGRDVVILPDADAAGRKYADEVASILLRLDPPAAVRIVDLTPDADDGSDVADAYGRGQSDRSRKALREKIERLADETEPLRPEAATPAVTSSSTPVEAYQPYPVDALPEPLATYVAEAADAIGVDPAYVALPLLTVAGAAIGTTRRLELKAGWSCLPILWTVVVGESGTKKSAPLRLVLEHVKAREKRLREEHALDRRDYDAAMEAYEKSRSAWRADKKAGSDPPERPTEPVSRRALVTDTTTEALAVKLADAGRGLLLARDELAGWLGSLDRYAKSGGGSGDEAFYLSAYNGESHAVDRRTGDRREIYVASAALWITGTIQPTILRRALGTERRESGLLARLLLTAPPPRPVVWTEKEVSPLTRQWLHDVLDRLYELQPETDAEGREEPRLVRLEPAAKAAYVQWHDRHGEELAGLTGDRAAAWSKLTETGARLALIVHAVRVAAGNATSEDVDAESMDRALRLVEWHKHETRRVYSILGQTDEEAAERQSDDRLAAWIERRGGTTTARDLIAACRWIATSDEAEAALRRLVAAGRGEWHDRPPSERGGRPTRDFVLSRQPAVEAREPLPPKPASAKPRDEAAKRGFGCADADAVAQKPAAEPEAAIEI
jgi:hypothetical protein